MFVADLHASVYVWDISSIKCIWDTCVCVSEICMFIYMRYIWVYVWGMCVSLWCLRSVPKPDTGAEVLIVVVYVWYMSVKSGRFVCVWFEWIKIHVLLFVDLSEWRQDVQCGDWFLWMVYLWQLVFLDDVSMATCLCGWCIHGNLFVWMMYPWQLVCVDGVSMATGLCGWCICVDGVWEVLAVTTWCYSGYVCAIFCIRFYLMSTMCSMTQIPFYQKLVNKLSLCQICFVYFSVKSMTEVRWFIPLS